MYIFLIKTAAIYPYEVLCLKNIIFIKLLPLFVYWTFCLNVAPLHGFLWSH